MSEILMFEYGAVRMESVVGFGFNAQNGAGFAVTVQTNTGSEMQVGWEHNLSGVKEVIKQACIALKEWMKDNKPRPSMRIPGVTT